MRDLSILILSWNTRELTLRTLAAIRRHPPTGDYEIVVVDNDSSDGSADAIAAADPEVTLVRSPRNLGYGPGNNLAFRHCDGRLVLLLGSDTEVREGALDGLVDCLEREAPGVGAVTCRLEGPTGYPERANYGFPTVRDAVALYLGRPALARHVPRAFDHLIEQTVDQASGTCLLMERELIEEIGLFDEAYKIMYTDVELCQRIHDADREIMYTPAATIMHAGCSSTVQARGELRAQMYQDIARYFVARFGWRAAWLLPILVLRLSVKTRGRHLGALAHPLALRRTVGLDYGGTRAGARSRQRVGAR